MIQASAEPSKPRLVRPEEGRTGRDGRGGLRLVDGARAMPEPLLPRVAAGDRAAMAESVHRYGGLLWTIARSVGLEPADAEDAVQDAFIALWETAPRYDATLGAEPSFVGIVARRRMLDWRRRRVRRLRLDASAADASAAPEPNDPQADMRRTEIVRDVRRAIDTLAPAQRGVLLLALETDLTHEQIARSTGMPLGTVKTHVRRGLIKIRAMMGLS